MIGVVLVDAAVWAGWGTAVGWVASKVPDERLAADRGVLRLHPSERRLWESLGVRRWKRRLPDAGGVFGGRRKRPTRADLATFAVETRRAELVHWVVPLAVVAFPLWNPAWLTAVMVAYAAVANVPCLVAQRYNRLRLTRILARP